MLSLCWVQNWCLHLRGHVTAATNHVPVLIPRKFMAFFKHIVKKVKFCQASSNRWQPMATDGNRQLPSFNDKRPAVVSMWAEWMLVVTMQGSSPNRTLNSTSSQSLDLRYRKTFQNLCGCVVYCSCACRNLQLHLCSIRTKITHSLGQHNETTRPFCQQPDWWPT